MVPSRAKNITLYEVPKKRRLAQIAPRRPVLEVTIPGLPLWLQSSRRSCYGCYWEKEARGDQKMEEGGRKVRSEFASVRWVSERSIVVEENYEQVIGERGRGVSASRHGFGQMPTFCVVLT